MLGLRPATLLKKRLWHRCFLVNFLKFRRTAFLTEYLQWLVLTILSWVYRFIWTFDEFVAFSKAVVPQGVLQK